MKSNTAARFLFTLTFLLSTYSFGQTQQEIHTVPFQSGVQNMFGPSFNAITIDQTINLFGTSWNETFGTGNAGIVTILGQSFGAAINGHINGNIGMDFSLNGFSAGTVEVDYPIDITNTVTDDGTYDPGDEVLIETDYEVLPGASLETGYPTAGEASLDFYFSMGFGLSATVCVFGCTTFPVIPSFNTGLININIFTINQTQADFLTISAGPLSFGPVESIPGLPVSTSIIPNDPLGNFGLEGILDLPYVETSDFVDPVTGDMFACGGGVGPDPEYLNISLSVFALLGNLPPPVGPVLGNLSGSEDLLGLATLSWNFFSTEIVFKIENKQCFDFTPKVYGQYQFPVPVEYTSTLPDGTSGPSGTSSIINLEIGGTLTYRYPCYYNQIDIQPTYSIDGIFRNHTYDSVSIEVVMQALAFGLEIPPIEITPAITVPEICISIPYPCPSWSNPFKWCSTTVCTPSFTIPAVGYSGFNLQIGPLLDVSLPLADFTYDWYDNTWSLEGFSTFSDPSFQFSMFSEAIPDLSIISTTDVSCFDGNDGAINTQMIQTTYDPATFNYVWSNGSTAASPTGLTAGTYSLILHDSHGCNYFAAATITEPSKVEILSTTQDASCNGNADGVIDVTVSGGTTSGNYTYTWTTANGSGLVPGAEDQFTLGAGTYDLTVSDDNGCIATQTFVIEEPNVLGQSGAITHVDCKNNLTGAIQVGTFGGTPQYTYLWDTGETTEDIINIGAGVHTLTITDSKGCQSIQSYTVNEPANVLALTVDNFTDVDCHGSNTGAINITTTGGNIPGGYSYTWTNAGGIVLPMQTEDIANLVAETYNLLVTDSKGCQATISQVISEPVSPLSSTSLVTDILCFGQATGAVDPGIAGGTPNYSYAWSNGTTGSILSAVTAGNYDLTVTDANGCTDTYSYQLDEPLADLSLTLSGVDILCFGESTGSISSAVSGGTAPYNYLWTGGGQTTADITNLPVGNYELTVTDSHGCSITDNLTLSQPAAPVTLSTVVTDVDCHGSNTGAIDLTIAGGTAPYSQLWSNGVNVVMTDTTQDISDKFADTYTVIVTDDHGCESTVSATIAEPLAPLSITGIIDDANCFQINDGAIDATVSGGTFPYNFAWSNGSTTEDISGLLAGDYTLTATDGNACVDSMTFTVDEPNAPLMVTTLVTDVKCNGTSDGEIETSVQGGTGPYTYNWSNGDSTPNLIGAPAGTYTLTVTDAQGCTAFTGATITEPTALTTSFVVVDASCYGYDDGSIEMTVSGGVAPYSFDWGNQNSIFLNNPSELLDSLIAEDYFIRVRDNNGCIVEQTITVGEPTPFLTSAVVTDASCFDGADGAIDVTTTGGSPAYTYLWNTGATTEDLTGLTTGVYTYAVTDNQGCIVRDSAIINQPSEIGIEFEINPLSCIDQTDGDIFVYPYGGTPQYTYSWSTGATSQFLEDVPPGVYDVIITDNNGCTMPFSFEIEMNPDECINTPNTFTPNGDNYNDTWVIRNIELYPDAVIKVFNKWGNEVYDTQIPYEPWDGTYNGNPLPSAVYYYIIILGNEANDEYTGTITIIR